MAHWTSTSDSAFIHRITFDFVAQLEKRLDALGWKQSDLAKKLNLSEGAVSQVLNNARENLTLRTMVTYASAVRMKVAIVAYDDGDPSNQHGPVNSEIFSTAWNRIGRPRDMWTLNECVQAATTNRATPQNWNLYSGFSQTFASGGQAHTAWNRLATSSDRPTVAWMTSSMEKRSTVANA